MHIHRLRAFAMLLAAIVSLPSLRAQNGASSLPLQDISGIVNHYVPVTGFEGRSGVRVTDASRFAPCDVVLIIQMQGAKIDTADGPFFGTVLDYGDAGKYEFGAVASIAGNVIRLLDDLGNRYTPGGRVQFIRVPSYDDIRVRGGVTGLAWDGMIGGVIAIDARNSIRLAGDIDAAGLGFRGGRPTQPFSGTQKYDIEEYASPFTSSNGGEKGEGIVVDDNLRNSCSGPRANGGGGGNAHNAGGGGGGNLTAGGVGGQQYSGFGSRPTGGIGGRALAAAPGFERIFLGGGGGAGDDNDRTGTAGGNGGGIVIIRTKQLFGNGYTIKAVGMSAAGAGPDGAGGGGAGGTVVLEAADVASALTVDVSGGHGGDNRNTLSSSVCHAPGGGGAGGTLRMTSASIPAALTLSNPGGLPGNTTNANSTCYNTPYGAGIGAAGTWQPNALVPGSSSGLVNVLATSDTAICPGDSVQLHATELTDVIWSPAEGLSCTTCPHPRAAPTTTTTYHVSAASPTDCFLGGSVTVTVLDGETLEIGHDVELCLGDSILLAGSEGRRLHWSPADGLSCTDCPSPMASPGRTTTYVATLTGTSGCTATDSVMVRVEAPRTIPIRIDRSLHVTPGDEIIVPVTLDGSISELHRVGRLRITIGYDPTVIRLRGASTRGALLDGWSAKETPGRGTFSAEYTYDGVRYLHGEGPLLYLVFMGFVGRALTTELPITADAVGAYCITLTPEPGHVKIDSICGLSFRMIELAASKTALGAIAPNPATTAAEITFSLGFEGDVQLDMLDDSGTPVTRLAEGRMAAGEHVVTLDATRFPSGVYYCRLRFGDRMAVKAMMLTR